MVEDVLVSMFTNRVDPTICNEVFPMRVVGLEDMMDTAYLAEEKIEMACTKQSPYGKGGKSAQKPTVRNSKNVTI